VTLASNESDWQKRALLARELLQLLQHESKAKRRAASA
jgi:hypothetical protein